MKARLCCGALALLVALGGGPVMAQSAAPAPAESDGSAAARIEIVGTTAFSENEMRDAIAEAADAIAREGVTPATADDAAFFLELFFRRHGYARAIVTPTPLPGGRLRLKVEGGELVTLGQIKFIGGAGLPEDRRKEYFLGPTRTRVPAGKVELPFIQGDINAGRDALLEYFQAEGFLDAQIDKPIIIMRGGTADVQVRIREGRRYAFGPVSFSGVPGFVLNEKPERVSWVREHLLFQKPKVDTWKQVLRDVKKISKEPFTDGGADAMARKVEEYLKRKGFYSATATASAKRGGGTIVPVHITATPCRQYRIGEITVQGTDRLKDAYVRNRFRELQGKIYDPARMDAVFQDEMKTGLFQSLRINPQPRPDGTLDLDLVVKEAKAREIGFSLGYGTYDGPIVGIEARDRNIFGTGRPLSFRATYSARTINGELLYRDPHWLESDFVLQLKAAAGGFFTDSYDKREAGLYAQLTRKVTKEIELGGFLSGRAVKITDSFVSPQNLGPDSYTVGLAGFTVTLDFRDSPLIPARGLVINSTVDYSSGSGDGDQFSFIRTTGRLSYYIPITKRSSLALGFRFGALDTFGRGDIPIDERFFNGGATSVRSFAERRLGPRDRITGNPIGSLAYTIMNVEYGFPIVGDLRGAIFYDVGNLTPSLGFDNLRSGVGAGLRYNLPIGPLRVDYGVNPSPRRSESRGALHVSFGIAF